MIPDFPKAKAVLAKQQTQFFEFQLKIHLGPLFGNISKKPMYEGLKMEYNYQEGYTYNNDLKKMEAGFTVQISELRQNPFLIYDKLDEMALDFAGQQIKMTIGTISEVTEMTGNVVDSRGEITPEKILEMWEKMEIDFNADGTPIRYSLVAGPEMLEKIKTVLLEMENNEVYKNKMKDLMDNKREAWYDRENNRKLVG